MRGAYSKCAIDKTKYFVDDPFGGSHADISGALLKTSWVTRAFARLALYLSLIDEFYIYIHYYLRLVYVSFGLHL
jgi:hypothetical protein